MDREQQHRQQRLWQEMCWAVSGQCRSFSASHLMNGQQCPYPSLLHVKRNSNNLLSVVSLPRFQDLHHLMLADTKNVVYIMDLQP